MTAEEYYEGEEQYRDSEDAVSTELPSFDKAILPFEDFEVGQYVCVYNCRQSPEEPMPIMGQSMKIKAICLPFFVVETLVPEMPPIMTLDVRFVNMMKVTKEYAEAQTMAQPVIDKPVVKKTRPA